MEEAGLSREKSFIKETNLGMADGYIAMRELLSSGKRPTAVFAFGDLLALGAYKAIEEAGLVIPNQIALAGYDDISVAELISLTTVAQDNFEIGRMGTEMLLKQIQTQGRALHQKVILQPRLVIRSSTRPKGQ
jgi:LacI family transcriptional regulator